MIQKNNETYKFMDKISIIIPVYNGEMYIEKCLESVIKQTYYNLEIIIINDGSTDKSLDICNNYKKYDNRIIIVDMPNKGVSNARNKGLEIMTGKYVMFLDSDDWIDHNMINKMYSEIIDNNSDMCICNYIIENNGNHIQVNSNIIKGVLTGANISSIFTIPLIGGSNNINSCDLSEFRAPWGKLYKVDIINKNRIRFRKELIVGEDFIFILEYLKYVDCISIIEENLYYYVYNEQSITKKYKDDSWNRIYKCIILNLEKYLKDNNLWEESKDRFYNLILKYFKICIYNESSFSNTKATNEKIRYIEAMCNDLYIEEALKKISRNKYSIKDKIILFLAKYKKSKCIYTISHLKLRK